MVTCCLTVAGWLKKLGKLTGTSARPISSRKGAKAGAAALGKLDQLLEVEPTSAGPLKLYGLARSHSSSEAGRQLLAEIS